MTPETFRKLRQSSPDVDARARHSERANAADPNRAAWISRNKHRFADEATAARRYDSGGI